MQAIRLWAGALASACFFVSTASAQYSPYTGHYHSPVTRAPLGIAPDAMGPGFYVYCPNGQTLGPNYCLRPPFEPYNGVRPNLYRTEQGRIAVAPPPPMLPTLRPTPQQQQAAYPYHPYARSPRDFFMYRENLEEQSGRVGRPNLVP